MAITLEALPRFQTALSCVHPVNSSWRDRAEIRLASLTKPPHSLGRLEWLAARLCAIQGTLSPRAEPRRIVIFAADHGVAAERVSAYPAAVTAQMVSNFLQGGAAINAVVDVGVAGHVDTGGNGAQFTSRRVRAGTRNIAEGPAMSVDELAAAIDVGLEVADAAAARGIAVLACGDMGLGNTTAASAMTAALANVSAAEVTGHGTGIDEDTFRRKVDVVTRALRVNQPGREPLDVLRTVGGLEIAAIVGAYIGAAGRRMAIVGDGLITTAAACVAAELCPPFLDYWFAGHQSPEPGHAVQLALLRQQPLLQLGMRLGEGTGAALAMHLLSAATAVINDMATFESAGISKRHEAREREAAEP
jgi:nicotinate-nucleotide--dimethylbenzimidazole phosphoribosyltransferase